MTTDMPTIVALSCSLSMLPCSPCSHPGAGRDVTWWSWESTDAPDRSADTSSTRITKDDEEMAKDVLRQFLRNIREQIEDGEDVDLDKPLPRLGQTPLMFATTLNDVAMVNFLLDEGADPLVAAEGFHPIHNACQVSCGER